jgi:two-component system, response regulator
MSAETQVDILLVEDNPRDAEMAVRELKKRHRLVWLKDGAQALEYVLGAGRAAGQHSRTMARHHPRLILLDIKLPKIDGLEVLRRLKADPEAKTIPVVLMTSSREERDVWRSYELGVNSYVVKPVRFSDFSEAVSQLGFYWVCVNHLPESQPVS